MLITMLALTACSDYDLKRTEDEEVYMANIKVDPLLLNFGEVPTGETAIQQFNVMNIGNVDLALNSIVIDGASNFTLMGAPPSESLAPEEQITITVLYESMDGEASAYANVNSDDPDEPQVQVELIAGVSYPELRITPNPYDFGLVAVGSTVNHTIELSNVGAGDITIDEMVITSGPFDAWFNEVLPATIPGGETLDLKVSYTPISTAASTADVRITHSLGEDTVELLGSGDADLPVALCEVTPDEMEPLGSPATWVGHNSYDPSGLAITNYVWTLTSKPSGSAASMPAGDANRGGFVPDLAGTYVGELFVTNSAGLNSAPCTASLEVIPAEDFWIEMFWVHSGDDMDLHLLAPGGTLESRNDCYFANCVGAGLNWGSASSAADDPSLDLDDIPGTGPENINIGSPENGEYTVVVHDYPGSTYSSSNDVTVKIYIAGAMVWTDTKSISGEDSYTNFARVSWGPAPTVTGL